MPRIKWLGAYGFCPVCLFVCLSVGLSVVNFNIRYNFWNIRDRGFIFDMHTQRMFSNDTKVNDLVTLTLTFMLKQLFQTVADRGIVFHKQTLIFFSLRPSPVPSAVELKLKRKKVLKLKRRHTDVSLTDLYLVQVLSQCMKFLQNL